MKDKKEKGRGKFNSVFLEETEVSAPSASLANRLLVGTRRTFTSLQYENFLYLWVGGWFSNVGTWIQSVALNWLVWEISRSSVSLGIVQFANTIPVFLLAFYAGVIADRISRKKLIYWSNLFSMLFAFMLGFLVGTNLISMYSIIVLSLFSGVAFAFAFPSWQSIISELIPKKDLMNAIALNSVQFHAARLLGPSIAGFIVAHMGMNWAFYLNAMSFLSVLIALSMVSYTPDYENRSAGNSFSEIVEGFKYAWEKKQVFKYLMAVGAISVFGLAFYIVLVPIFAGKILNVGVKGYGFLLGANGFGALVGSLTVAWLSGKKAPQQIVRVSIPAFGLSLLYFAFSRNYYLSLTLMFVAGFFFLMTNSTLNTGVQAAVDNRFRGRIMSIFFWMFMGTSPFGSLMAGYLGKIFGIKGATAFGAAIIVLLGIAINFQLMKGRIKKK